MTKTTCSCMSGAALILFSGFVAAGAQQPIVARAARPGFVPVMQMDPGQPGAPQANNAPVKDDLFAGTEKFAKNATDVSEISMDPQTLGMVNGRDANKAHNMILSTVRSYTYDKPGMYNMADVEEYRHKLMSGDWHCSVHTREMKTGESTDICSRHPTPDTIESAIITVEPKELTFIHTIKKANGEGGGVIVGNGLEFIAPVSPEISMNILGPEMKAEMLAATAELQAEMPALMNSMGELKLNLPRLDSEQMQKSLRESRKWSRQFRMNQVFPTGPSMDVLPAMPVAPETPAAPDVPQAPDAPATPAAPQAPSSPSPAPAPQPSSFLL